MIFRPIRFRDEGSGWIELLRVSYSQILLNAIIMMNDTIRLSKHSHIKQYVSSSNTDPTIDYLLLLGKLTLVGEGRFTFGQVLSTSLNPFRGAVFERKIF